MVARRQKLVVVPAGALDFQHEDFVAVGIECEKTIDAPMKKTLAALYASWVKRVAAASAKMAREDGDEVPEIRFDDLSVKGSRALGGAARVLTLGNACPWLAKELGKIEGVAKVVFGEEDDGTEATLAPVAVSDSAVVTELKTSLANMLKPEDRTSAVVLGLISIRFGGSSLTPLGSVLLELIDEAIALGSPSGGEPVWVRGCWGPHDALEEVNQGKNVREKAGRELLERILRDEVREFPRTDRDPCIIALVVSDGPRPERKGGMWVDGSRTAASFGVHLSLEPIEGRPGGGGLEVYVPLGDLEAHKSREKWVAFGQRAFEALKGSVGSAGLGLWMEALKPDEVPLELVTKMPPVAITRVVGSHAGGFNWPDFSPSLLEGFFEPGWVTWLSPELAKKVTAFPGEKKKLKHGVQLRAELPAPLTMTEVRYVLYQRAWRALDSLRLKWSTTDEDDHYAWRLSLERYDAPSFAALPTFLKERQARAKRRTALHWKLNSALANNLGEEAFAYAQEALDLGARGEASAKLLEAACLSGKASHIRSALDRLSPLATTNREVALLAAKGLMLLGDQPDAIEMLARAPQKVRRVEAIEDDAAFAPLHGDETFRRVLGWLSPGALAKRGRATPDLKAFRKLKKALVAAPESATFGEGASPDEVKQAEKALKTTFPETWRALLKTFNGATFQNGREHIYSTQEMIEHNRDNQDWESLKVGRRLELMNSKGFGKVQAGVQNYLEWKTVDQGLAALAIRQ